MQEIPACPSLGSPSLFLLQRRTVGVRHVDRTLNHLEAGLIQPAGGIVRRRAVRPDLVDRRCLAVDRRCRIFLLLFFVARFRPRLHLAGREYRVEGDAEEVDNAGDEVDRLPLGDCLRTARLNRLKSVLTDAFVSE